MSRPHSAVSYRAVLALPGARRAFFPVIIGRLSYGTLPLALLFAVEQSTGSYGVAGAVLAIFGLTALIDPMKSRLIDRSGQQRVLGLLGIGYPATMLAFAVLTHGKGAEPAHLFGLALAAGVLTPPLGPSMRMVWSAIAPNAELKLRAYSLDSVVEESLYAIGPAIVGGILLVGSADLAVAVTAVLAAIGTVGLATAPAAARTRQRGTAVRRLFSLGPLAARGFVPVLVAIAGAGLALGVLDIAVPVRASDDGHPAAAGLLLAMMAVGSTVGGLLWGRRTRGASTVRHLGALALLLAIGIALLAGITDLAVLAAGLLVIGTLIAPMFILAYVSADDLAPEGQKTEASTWINTANNLGSAAGAAMAGLLVDRTTLTVALVAGAVILASSSVPLWIIFRVTSSPTEPMNSAGDDVTTDR